MDRHAESSTIRWLHLSDFHVGKDAYAQHRIIEHIHHHVREAVAEKGTPNFVFVTGDLAQSGKDQEYTTNAHGNAADQLDLAKPLQAKGRTMIRANPKATTA